MNQLIYYNIIKIQEFLFDYTLNNMLFKFLGLFIEKLNCITKEELDQGIAQFLESRIDDIKAGKLDPDEIILAINKSNENNVYFKYSTYNTENIDNLEKNIPYGPFIYNIIVENVSILLDTIMFNQKISNILIYKSTDDEYLDYFGKLKFKYNKKYKKYLDETGIFTGILLKTDSSSILDKAKMTEIGFIQPNTITLAERKKQLRIAINIVKKIFRIKNLNLMEQIYTKNKKRTLTNLLQKNLLNTDTFIKRSDLNT